MKSLHWSLTGLVALASPKIVLAQQSDQIPGPYMWHGEWHAWFFGSLMMIAALVVAVVLIVLLIRWLGGGQAIGHHTAAARTPLDILRERFAKGEIDKEEFEERRRLLRD